MTVPIKGLALAALMTFGLAAQQPPAVPAIHAKSARRLVIKNAMVIYGNAKPAYGPVDIVVQDGLISYIGPADAMPSTRPRRSRGVSTVTAAITVSTKACSTPATNHSAAATAGGGSTDVANNGRQDSAANGSSSRIWSRIDSRGISSAPTAAPAGTAASSTPPMVPDRSGR